LHCRFSTRSLNTPNGNHREAQVMQIEPNSVGMFRVVELIYLCLNFKFETVLYLCLTILYIYRYIICVRMLSRTYIGVSTFVL
jgi:hypothetical protein